MQRASVIIVAIIAVVGGSLLFLAIDRARRSQELVECKRQLSVLGAGLHNYNGIFLHFPQGTYPNKALPPEKRLSWLVSVWPVSLGSGPDKVLIDWSAAWDVAPNREPKYTVLEDAGEREPIPFVTPWGMHCPASQVADAKDLPSFTHYVGVAGIGDNAATLPLSHKRAGFFGYDRKLRIAELVDGASNTMAIAETGWKNGPWTAGGFSTVRGVVPPPIGPDCYFGGTHAGGALFAFADAAVHFLNHSIDQRVFDALATIAGREQVGRVWDE